MQTDFIKINNELHELKGRVRSLEYEAHATCGRIIEFNRAFDNMGVDVDNIDTIDSITGDEETSSPSISTLRCINIPLRDYDEWINYSSLARVIAIAGAKGMSLEDFMCEAASDLIGIGESFEELKDWVSDHLADICREARLLSDARYTSEKYFWTLIHNLVDEAEAHSSHLQ